MTVYASTSIKKSEVSPERLVRQQPHLTKLMVSVRVSKLGRTGVMFIEKGAKVNSDYYTKSVLPGKWTSSRRQENNLQSIYAATGRCSLSHCSTHDTILGAECSRVHQARVLASKQSRFKSSGLLDLGRTPAKNVPPYEK